MELLRGIKFVLFFIVLLTIKDSLFASTLLRPTALDDLWPLKEQKKIKISASIAWIDYSALRRDFLFLGKLTELQIDDLVLKHCAFLTREQKQFLGILMDNFPEVSSGDNSDDTYHPEDYDRASMVYFSLNKDSSIAGEGGLVDLKGTGVANNAIEKMAVILSQRAGIRRGIAAEELQKDAAFQEWRDEVKFLRSKIGELGSSPNHNSSDPTIKKRLTHEIDVWSEGLRQYELFGSLADGVFKSIELPEKALEKYDAHLRSMDYRNGLLPLSRAVKEVVLQKSGQILFDRYNSTYGTTYRTIDNYFILAIDANIIGDKSVLLRAGILGRQAHWRNRQFKFSNTPSYPSEIFSPGLADADQADIFGAIVDFELLEMKTAKPTNLFTPNRFGNHPFDGVATYAVAAYSNGNNLALQHFIEQAIEEATFSSHIHQAAISGKLNENEKDFINISNMKLSEVDVVNCLLQRRGLEIDQFESDKAFWTIAVEKYPQAVFSAIKELSKFENSLSAYFIANMISKDQKYFGMLVKVFINQAVDKYFNEGKAADVMYELMEIGILLYPAQDDVFKVDAAVAFAEFLLGSAILKQAETEKKMSALARPILQSLFVSAKMMRSRAKLYQSEFNELLVGLAKKSGDEMIPDLSRLEGALLEPIETTATLQTCTDTFTE